MSFPSAINHLHLSVSSQHLKNNPDSFSVSKECDESIWKPCLSAWMARRWSGVISMHSLKVNRACPTWLPSVMRGEKWTLSTLTSVTLSALSHTTTSQANSENVDGIGREWGGWTAGWMADPKVSQGWFGGWHKGCPSRFNTEMRSKCKDLLDWKAIWIHLSFLLMLRESYRFL